MHRLLLSQRTQGLPTTGSPLHLFPTISIGPESRKHSNGRTTKFPTLAKAYRCILMVPIEWIVTIRLLRLYLTGTQVIQIQSGVLLQGVRAGEFLLEKIARTANFLLKAEARAVVKVEGKVAVRAVDRAVDKVAVKEVDKEEVKAEAKVVPAPPRLLRPPHLLPHLSPRVRPKVPSPPLPNLKLRTQLHPHPLQCPLASPVPLEHPIVLVLGVVTPTAGRQRNLVSSKRMVTTMMIPVSCNGSRRFSLSLWEANGCWNRPR